MSVKSGAENGIKMTPPPRGRSCVTGEFLARLQQHRARVTRASDNAGHPDGANPALLDQLPAIVASSGRGILDLMDDAIELSSVHNGGRIGEAVPFHLLDTFLAIFAETPGTAGRLAQVFDPKASAHYLGYPGIWRRVASLLRDCALDLGSMNPVEVRMTIGENGHGVLLEVETQGTPLKPAELANLFELPEVAMSDATAADPGWRLGLALCRQLARILGGELALADRKAAAATGRLCLQFYCPFERLAALPALVGQTTGAPMKAAGPFAPKVLVAEDNPANQRVISIILGQLGCAVTIAEHGKACVDLFAGAAWDLVLMDLHMPVMDGYAATRAIRASGMAGRAVTIVALTADARDEARAEAEAAGVDDFLTKPVVAADIAAVLNRIEETAAGSQRLSRTA